MTNNRVSNGVCIYTLSVYFLALNDSRRRIVINANYAIADDWVGLDYAKGNALFMLQLIVVALIAYNVVSFIRDKKVSTFYTVGLAGISALVAVSVLRKMFSVHFLLSFADWHLLASSVLLFIFLFIKRNRMDIQLPLISVYFLFVTGVYYSMEGQFERNVHPNEAEYLAEQGMDGDSLKIRAFGRYYLGERTADQLEQELEDKGFNGGLYFWNLAIGSFSMNEQWGIVNNKGEVIKEPFADDVSFSATEIGIFSKDGKYGLVNSKGAIIKEPFADEIIFTNNEIGSFGINGKWGIINNKGEIVKEPFADRIYFENNEMGIVTKQGKMGFVNSEGTIIKEPFADRIRPLSEGYYSYYMGEKAGIIRQDLHIIRYPFALELRKSDYPGLFYAENDKYFSALIDIEGNVVAGWENNLLKVDGYRDRPY